MEVHVFSGNIRIDDSAFVSKKEFEKILTEQKTIHPNNEVFKNRTIFSMKMEWAVHNFLYNLGIKREQTKDVDLDFPCDKPEWLYKVLGCLVWLFIK